LKVKPETLLIVGSMVALFSSACNMWATYLQHAGKDDNPPAQVVVKQMVYGQPAADAEPVESPSPGRLQAVGRWLTNVAAAIFAIALLGFWSARRRRR
jgi:hypothetical protein